VKNLVWLDFFVFFIVSWSSWTSIIVDGLPGATAMTVLDNKDDESEGASPAEDSFFLPTTHHRPHFLAATVKTLVFLPEMCPGRFIRQSCHSLSEY
jgi:hypothetical protein